MIFNCNNYCFNFSKYWILVYILVKLFDGTQKKYFQLGFIRLSTYIIYEWVGTFLLGGLSMPVIFLCNKPLL